MLYKHIILLIYCGCFLFTTINGQQSSTKKINGCYFPPSPCFLSDGEQNLVLPDSLSLKKRDQIGYFAIDCAFDSLSHFIWMQSVSITIYDHFKNKIKAFYFFDNPTSAYHSFNFPKTEARAYVDWAMKTIPSTAKIKRVPYSYKCGENITDTIYRHFHFQIE